MPLQSDYKLLFGFCRLLIRIFRRRISHFRGRFCIGLFDRFRFSSLFGRFCFSSLFGRNLIRCFRSLDRLNRFSGFRSRFCVDRFSLGVSNLG